MITITLDTSCIDQKAIPFLNQLRALQDQNKIRMFMVMDSFWEKHQYQNRIRKLEDLAWMLSNVDDEDQYAVKIPEGKTIDDVQPFDIDKYQNIYRRVRAIHSPEFRGKKLKNLTLLKVKKQINKHHDWKILTKHILSSRDYFITLNTNDFINHGRKDAFKGEFNIEIRELNQKFINELKGILNKNQSKREK